MATPATQFNAEANKAARMKGVGARIVEFANIDATFADDPETGAALKARMIEVMDPIDKDPTNFNAIVAYGTAPIDAMGVIAKQILEAQTRLDDQVKVMDFKIRKITESAAEQHLASLWDAAKKAGAATGSGVMSAGSKVGGWVGSAWNKIFDKKKKMSEDEKEVQALVEQLPEMYFEMQALLQELNSCEKGIADVMDMAKTVGISRVNMVREMNIYLGAATEVLRRYDEQYIPEAREAAYDEAGNLIDAEAEIWLQDVVKGRENFQDQYNILEASRAKGLDAAEQLKKVLGELEKQRKLIIQVRTFRENEWTSLMVETGIQASSLKIEGMIKQTNDQGDRMQELQTAMGDKTHQMRMEAASHMGTISNDKLIAALQNRAKQLEEETNNFKRLALEAESSRKKLRAETEKFIESNENMLKTRMLEAAPVDFTNQTNDSRPFAPANDDTAVVEEAKADVASTDAANTVETPAVTPVRKTAKPKV